VHNGDPRARSFDPKLSITGRARQQILPRISCAYIYQGNPLDITDMAHFLFELNMRAKK
jgi:hypothetical protein